MKGNPINNKRYAVLILVCIALIVTLVVYKINTGKEKGNPNKNVVTAGQVARAVSLLMHTDEECRGAIDKFTDKSEKWYVPYMNMMYQDEYFSIKKIKPTDSGATGRFTYKNLDDLFTNMEIEDENLWSYIKNNSSSNAIITEEWNEIYERLIELLDTGGNIKKKETNIVGTISNVPALDPWITVTSDGKYDFSGLAIDFYIDKKVEIYTRGNKLLCVKSVKATDITYDNAWVISVENGRLKAYIDGAVREFDIEDKKAVHSSVVADIKLSKKKVKNFDIKEETISGKVLVSGKDGIELEGNKKYELAENVKVYKIYGSLEIKSVKDILVGYDIQKFVMSDGKICAVIIDRDINASNVRVLIMNTNHQDIYHDEVVISSESGYQVSYGKEIKTMEENSELKLKPDSKYMESGRVIITPTNVNGKIMIKNIERDYGTPSYRGTIEVSVRNGRMIIVNELSIEEYLYAVVPSEMTYTYNEEALKTQAVCARTYVYKNILNNSCSEFGAHVDDSTNYQVYNNFEEKESTTKAVDDTYGQVMSYEGQIVDALFFSTSCGSTTDTTCFGGRKTPYLTGKILSDKKRDIDLTNESNFDAFIRSQYDTYDSEYSWYRWTLEMSLKDIKKTVNSVIEDLYNNSPNNVLVFNEESEKFEFIPISSLGEIKRIELGDRGAGGILNYIVIYGSEATVKVSTENSIRKLFYPVSKEIKKNDGSTNSSFGMLPSAYFVLDPILENGKITGYSFIGGGYGHGVGMSQNASNTMGEKGMTYKEILQYFYDGIKIENVY